MRRYLFGPVSATFAAQNLAEARRQGACLAFDDAGTADLAIGLKDTWDQVLARLPEGWQPDAIVLHLPYTTIPACLWTAPVPRIAWGTDLPLLWHGLRPVLGLCDLVLADAESAARLQAAGITRVQVVNTAGMEQAYVEESAPDSERGIDILLVGNLHPAVQRERLADLTAVTRLGERYRVAIHTGVFGADYRQLLRRAKLVVNLTRPGHLSRRVFEAAACGAAVLQPEVNAALLPNWRDGHEWIVFPPDGLAPKCAYYLERESERQTVAQAGQTAAAEYTFARLWEECLASWDLPAISSLPDPATAMAAQAAHQLCSAGPVDPRLGAQLRALVSAAAQPAHLHHLLALLVGRTAPPPGPGAAAVLSEVLEHLRAAVRLSPHPLYVLNLAEALALSGQGEAGAQHARQALAFADAVDDPTHPGWDSLHFPLGFDTFRVEWDRAGFAHAGNRATEVDAKRGLLRWRSHTLLAQLTNDTVHAYEAVLARPDLPTTRAALGGLLAGRGQPQAARSHLEAALAGNPLDRHAARSLMLVLDKLELQAAREALAADRRLLAAAAPHLVPPEPWFARRASPSLVSIIILCCNELEYTRLCLESVLARTTVPYELIVVNNGSTDGTFSYLEELRRRPGPRRTVVLHNETNCGFPAGCNQGLAQAEGDRLLFLNNDTIVTPGWLEGLLEHQAPDVGMVGAITNYAPPPQGLEVGYADLEQMLTFATQQRRTYAGQTLAVTRLSGFCLLAQRQVLQRLGGFDERFGIGLFDDDDISLRVRQAGYRLVVALDVFIHHFGSRTFQGLGLDAPRLLEENLGRFRAKWGASAVEGYRLVHLAHSPLAPAAPAGRRRVSLTMIVKNEEANLPRCLPSVRDLVDELIVVDTGSKDRTAAIAAQHGATVYHFPWIDHFAAARNEALRHATGDWIFWLDADDSLDDENRDRLRGLFARLDGEKDAYAMKVRSGLDPERRAVRLLDQVRLFPRHPQIRWDYRIHEQILPAVRRQGGNVRWAQIVIDHHGYIDADVRRKKLQRNVRLLRLDDAEGSNDAFTLFNLGWTLLDLGETQEALLRLKRSLELASPDASIVRKLCVLLAQGHRQLGQREQALRSCQEGRKRCPDDLELPFEEAMLRREQGDVAGAERCLRDLLAIPPGKYFGSVDPDLRSVKVPHLLTELCRRQGRLEEALAHCQDGLAAQPKFLPLWLEKGEISLAQRDWSTLEQVADTLEHATALPLEAAILRARGHRARHEYAAARALLEGVIGGEPKTLGPRLLLSHVLLEEGRDWAAAEAMLTSILELAPAHPETTHNLTVLRRQLQGNHSASKP